MTETTKKLYRSADDRIIAGVCGGIAQYFNIDPVLVRIVFIAFALIHGLGIVLYLAFLFLVPKEGEAEMLEKVIAFSKHLKKDAKPAEEPPAGETPAKDIEEPAKPTFAFIRDKKRLIGLAIVVVGGFALLNSLFHLSWFEWDVFWAVAVIIVGFYLIVRKNNH